MRENILKAVQLLTQATFSTPGQPICFPTYQDKRSHCTSAFRTPRLHRRRRCTRPRSWCVFDCAFHHHTLPYNRTNYSMHSTCSRLDSIGRCCKLPSRSRRRCTRCRHVAPRRVSRECVSSPRLYRTCLYMSSTPSIHPRRNRLKFGDIIRDDFTRVKALNVALSFMCALKVEAVLMYM